MIVICRDGPHDWDAPDYHRGGYRLEVNQLSTEIRFDVYSHGSSPETLIGTCPNHAMKRMAELKMP